MYIGNLSYTEDGLMQRFQNEAYVQQLLANEYCGITFTVRWVQ